MAFCHPSAWQYLISSLLIGLGILRETVAYRENCFCNTEMCFETLSASLFSVAGIPHQRCVTHKHDTASATPLPDL